NAPIIGNASRLNLFSQFARTLSTLMHNGVPVLLALKITELVIDNVIIKEAIANTREAVTDGKSIAQPLAKSGIFPQLMIDMVKIGDETGDIPGALQSLAETYEEDLQGALRVMTSMIEPMLIIVMALFVGFILLGILSAMFSLTSNINR
ncbi:MAG: type II secretion system F family protein, partial [Verrucomicrobia bacterium]|nr:type II secretion system F family protein [Verrucomicrobiota bacterium]